MVFGHQLEWVKFLGELWSTLGLDVQLAGGSLQTCTGVEAGIEAAHTCFKSAYGEEVVAAFYQNVQFHSEREGCHGRATYGVRVLLSFVDFKLYVANFF